MRASTTRSSLALLLVLAGCSETPRCTRGACGDGAVSRFDGDVSTEDGAASSDGSLSDATSDGDLCGGAGISVTGTPPRVLVLFDRSCSMRRRVDDGTMFASGTEDPAGRWYVAREALRTLVTTLGARVQWGLVSFPEAIEECGVSPAIRVAPGPGGGSMMMADLELPATSPFALCPAPDVPWVPGQQVQITPTQAALDAALAAGATHVLLVTDGGATCGATPESLAASTTALRTAGTLTAVIGFTLTTEVAAATPMLDAIADAGGLAATGATRFYTADSSSALAAAFETIVRASISCTFTLESLPPDGDALFVSLDDVPVEMGPAGFTYDATAGTIELHGAACERVRAGEVSRIGVAYGCATPSCVPTDEVCDGLDNDCDGALDEGCLI